MMLDVQQCACAPRGPAALPDEQNSAQKMELGFVLLLELKGSRDSLILIFLKKVSFVSPWVLGIYRTGETNLG